MEYITLIGIVILVVGFALKLDSILVIMVAAVATALAGGLNPMEFLETLGNSFVSNRSIPIFIIVMVVTGTLERNGLKQAAAALMQKAKSASAGMVVGLYGIFRLVFAAFNVSFLTDLASVFPKLFQQMTAYYAVNGTVFALELLALMLAACMSFSLQFYAALAAGHSFANHKMALSVAFFFVFQFVVQMAGAIVLVLLDEGPLHQFLLTLDFQLTGVAAVHFTMVALLLLTVLYGAIFYIVTTITLKKRLNLE